MQEHHVSNASFRDDDWFMVPWAADASVESEDLAIVLFHQSKMGGKSWRRG